MDLSRLAARQKRLKDWTAFLDQVHREELRVEILDTLKLYRNQLAKCWEQETVPQEDYKHLFDLERELERLNEKARVTVRSPGSASDEGVLA